MYVNPREAALRDGLLASHVGWRRLASGSTSRRTPHPPLGPRPAPRAGLLASLTSMLQLRSLAASVRRGTASRAQFASALAAPRAGFAVDVVQGRPPPPPAAVAASLYVGGRRAEPTTARVRRADGSAAQMRQVSRERTGET